MARRRTTSESTTVKVETVGVDEIANAVSAVVRADMQKEVVAPIVRQLNGLDQKVNRVHRGAKTAQGITNKRIRELEAKVHTQDDDIQTLFNIVSGQNTAVTVTRHRPSRSSC
jgi:hypothetical protein